MKKPIDLTGQTFGRLKVLSRRSENPKRILWLCRCICGNYTEVERHKLTAGIIVSCGCRLKETQYKKQSHCQYGHPIEGDHCKICKRYTKFKWELNRTIKEKKKRIADLERDLLHAKEIIDRNAKGKNAKNRTLSH